MVISSLLGVGVAVIILTTLRFGVTIVVLSTLGIIAVVVVGEFCLGVRLISVMFPFPLFHPCSSVV
jgi:hypothetical protein